MRRFAPLAGLALALAACGGAPEAAPPPPVTTLTASSAPGPTEAGTAPVADEPRTPGDSAGAAATTITPAGREGPPEPEEPAAVPTTSMPLGNTAEVPSGLLQAVITDLATRLGTGDATIVLIAEAVVWPDGSLGCPAPGEVYEPAPVPGYRVVLESGGAAHSYHLADSGYFVLCPGALPPGTTP